MIPFNINMGGGGGRAAGATPPQDVEADQRRRAQVVQVGLILVLLLALFDTNRPPHSNLRQFKEVDKPKPSVFTDRLNSLLNENKRSLNSAFPKNVTGLYRGSWLKVPGISGEKYSPSSSPPTLHPVSLSLPVTITTSFSSSLSGEPTNSGKILMQLKSVSIDNIPDVSYVYGVIRLSGASPKGGDILYPIQGVFLSSIGSLTMMTSPFLTQSLYLEVPIRSGGNTPSKGVSSISASNTTTTTISSIISNSGSSNSSHDASLNISHNSSRISFVRRRLADERQEEVVAPAGRPRLWKSVLVSVRAMRSSLQRALLTEDALAEFTSPDILATHGMDSAGERGHHRRLFESSSGGVLAAIPLEYGMRLILADAASMKEFRRNQTGERYVEAIGEGLLPATFKNLQSSVLHLVSMGSTSSCQIGLHFQAEKVVANINDKDIPLLPGISSSSSAKLTPQVGTGESFSSNLNGAIAAEECGSGSGNAFNISAQSYHLQVNVVERKAMNYAIIATAVCFFQMGLLVLQLRYTQTQAMASKISILGMCAQSLIDALICIGHLLLCAAIPGIFFQHFMWIAILKLMIFCVFEMRAVVSIYHARYASLSCTAHSLPLFALPSLINAYPANNVGTPKRFRHMAGRDFAAVWPPCTFASTDRSSSPCF